MSPPVRGTTLAIFVSQNNGRLDPHRGALSLLCPEWASNPHLLRDTILSRARIPIPPPGHKSRTKRDWRRRGESNPCVSVLQTEALPLRHYAS